MKRLVYVGILVVLATACTVLALRVWYLTTEAANQRVAWKEPHTPTILKEAKVTTRAVDIQGRKHTTFKIPKAYEIKDLEDFPAAGLLDTTAQALNIKNSQIKSLSKLTASLEVKNLALQREINESKQEIYYYKDKYLSITYRTPITKDSLDFGYIDFKYNAHLNFTEYSKKKWLLGKSNEYVDIYSEDPRVTIQGLKTYSLKPKVKQSGFAVQATTQYDFKSNSLLIGPGISVDINRFNIQGKYLLNPTTSEWNWIANSSFNILKL